MGALRRGKAGGVTFSTTIGSNVMGRATPVTEERKSELAELAAQGLSAHMAAKKMGIAKSYAYRLWDEIKRDLGPQAA